MFSMKTLLSLKRRTAAAPLLLLFFSFLSVCSSLYAMYRLWRGEEISFMRNASVFSIGLLTVLNFQQFGVFMSLGLSYASGYFQYLTITGICCFLVSMTTNKLGFLFFLSQNLQNPRILSNGLSSPRARYHCVLVMVELIFYLAAFFVIKYPGYNYYILIFYLYPLFHILNAVYNGRRETFRWYVQF